MSSADPEPAAPRPLFVVSAPRSGSTFLVAALARHPEIAMSNEAGWIPFLRKASLLASTRSLDTIDDGEGFQTEGIIPERYVAATRGAFHAVIPSFLSHLYQSFGDGYRYFGDKLHSPRDLDFALKALPETRVIHLVRDLRDTLVSSFAFQAQTPTGWEGITPEDRCLYLDRFFTDTSEILSAREHRTLRYEDLVTDPATTLETLLAWLGLEPAEDVSRYLEGEATALFAAHGTSPSPAESLGRWRREIPTELQGRITGLLARHLRAFGYPVSD
jgi:hypothetical protein